MCLRTLLLDHIKFYFFQLIGSRSPPNTCNSKFGCWDQWQLNFCVDNLSFLFLPLFLFFFFSFHFSVACDQELTRPYEKISWKRREEENHPAGEYRWGRAGAESVSHRFLPSASFFPQVRVTWFSLTEPGWASDTDSLSYFLTSQSRCISIPAKPL